LNGKYYIRLGDLPNRIEFHRDDSKRIHRKIYHNDTYHYYRLNGPALITYDKNGKIEREEYYDGWNGIRISKINFQFRKFFKKW
jgi:hypothetical protein